MVLRHQGIRVRAALHLRWDDIDLAEGRITWCAAFDKLGRLVAGEVLAQTGDPNSPWISSVTRTCG